MKNLIYLLLLCCLTTLSALKCKKPQPATTPPDQLPAITTEGKNTFGCYVNGQLFIGKGGFNIPSISGAYSKGNFWIKSYYIKKNANENGFQYKQSIAFGFINKYNNGNVFNNELNNKNKAGFTDLNTIYKEYLTDSINLGYISFIKFDTINRIISGTFYFNAIASDSTKVSVTDGRFDLQY